MGNYPTIKYVEPLSNYRLFVIFDNGVIKLYCLNERLQTPAFQVLKDEKLFMGVQVGSGGYGLIWNDDLDLSEYELWTKGVEISSIHALAG